MWKNKQIKYKKPCKLEKSHHIKDKDSQGMATRSLSLSSFILTVPCFDKEASEPDFTGG